MAQVHELSPKGERRRTLILDVAIELFGEVGFRGTSLRDIATRAGLTHPGLLYHFASKEQLLQEVLRRRDSRNSELVGITSMDPVERLKALMVLVEYNETTRIQVQLFATLSAEATDPSHPAHEFFTTRYEEAVTRYRTMCEGLGERGLLRHGVDPEVAARTLIAVMDGMQIQWLYDPGVPMARVVREVADSLCVRPVAEL
ncbi:MAG TPA: TetR/AcrR family transcriptional regulator [Propionibacteriaceae bacterium]|nr:TetR/AcrR family transcriptional regulator [Propionibacteriaceae bacterium]